ncbi:hypothetical protein CSOJ01_04397 [Colletotrichum sojae]|uniref:Uncharacterized protein n=1 Tax=Colletotrichum sojae TaxID=2175907 RepID=A0A8H6JJ07_9PEZI|nr:hypothetical protein CSOJ01_04397 [Colletotrichum sojae]
MDAHLFPNWLLHVRSNRHGTIHARPSRDGSPRSPGSESASSVGVTAGGAKASQAEGQKPRLPNLGLAIITGSLGVLRTTRRDTACADIDGYRINIGLAEMPSIGLASLSAPFYALFLSRHPRSSLGLAVRLFSFNDGPTASAARRLPVTGRPMMPSDIAARLNSLGQERAHYVPTTTAPAASSKASSACDALGHSRPSRSRFGLHTKPESLCGAGHV